VSKANSGGAGNSDIGGSNGRRIQLRAARGTRKAKPRRTGFTRERKDAFLSFFAATANADASARAAGISKSTVHEHRRKDPVFRAAWYEALEEGYARVEALSVRWAEQAFSVRANPSAAKTARDMDPKVALAVLEAYRRNRGARPGDVLPQRSDVEQVRARIEKTMRALGLIRPEDEDEDEDGGEGEDGPSAIRSSADGPPPHPRLRGDREE
jgi:hypothetical protein